MLDTLTTVIAAGTFVLLLAGSGAWLFRRAAAEGLLAPLLVGGLLRLGVVLVAHVASVSAGDAGTFYLDDGAFVEQAATIAELWRDGSFIDLSTYTSSLNNGYQGLMASVFVLIGTSVIAVKLVNVLIGSATIVLAGLIGKRLFGELGKRRTAWVMALLPTAIWWSAVMLKETLVTLLVAAAILALLSPPRPRALVLFGAATVGLTLTRPTALAAVLVGAAVAYGVTAIRHRRQLDWRSLGLIAVGGAGGVVFVSLLLSAGDPGAPLRQLTSTAESMFDFYQEGVGQIPVDLGRIFFVPFPWNVDSPIGWDRALFPGVWLLIALTPTAVLGAWRLRRHEELLLVLVTIATSTTIYAVAAGAAYRQRSGIELLFVLLFVAGFDSPRGVVRRAGGALAIVAPLATVHVASAGTGALIAGAAAALWLAGGRLPAENRPVPEPDGLLLGQLEQVSLPGRELVLGPLRQLQKAAPPLRPLGARAVPDSDPETA